MLKLPLARHLKALPSELRALKGAAVEKLGPQIRHRSWGEVLYALQSHRYTKNYIDVCMYIYIYASYICECIYISHILYVQLYLINYERHPVSDVFCHPCAGMHVCT